jgi:hypothetical protein
MPDVGYRGHEPEAVFWIALPMATYRNLHIPSFAPDRSYSLAVYAGRRFR